MKVYMLNPPFLPHFGRGARWQDTGRGGTLYYPIWLSYATGVVAQEYETRLVDAPAWNWNKDDVIVDIRKFKPDLVVIDTSFPSLNNDIKVAEAIKQSHHAKVVLVGPTASQFSEEILQSKGIDIVARFEYDFTIREVAQAIDKNEAFAYIRGISYKDNGKIVHNPNREFADSLELDKIPFVSQVYKRYLNVKDYFLGSALCPEVQIFTGRGCPYHLCTFCSWPPTLMGGGYRVRSISNVLDELEWIQDNLPEVNEVVMEDDTFAFNKKMVMEFCQEYKTRGLNVTWSGNARATLDYETMKKMKDSNCRLLIVGYESGNDEILKNVKKGITVKQIKQFARYARKAGLLVHGDFIVGLPGETKETILETRRLIKEVKPDILQVSVASPFPGTEFYEWARTNGYLLTDDPNEYLDDQGHQKSIISYPSLSAEEITKTVDEILKSYYISMEYVPIALRQVIRRHGLQEMRRLWYSARMFARYVSRR